MRGVECGLPQSTCAVRGRATRQWMSYLCRLSPGGATGDLPFAAGDALDAAGAFLFTGSGTEDVVPVSAFGVASRTDELSGAPIDTVSGQVLRTDNATWRQQKRGGSPYRRRLIAQADEVIE